MNVEQRLLKKIAKEQAKRKAIETEGSRKTEPNLKAISDALDEYYFVSKLKTYCAYLSYTHIIQADKLQFEESDFRLMPAIIEVIKTQKIASPAIEFYNTIRILFENLGKNHSLSETLLQSAKKCISANQKLFTVEEQTEMYSYLTNYCIRKINLGQADYRKQLFLLNNEIINLKYRRKRSKKEVLPASVFKNMVVGALTLKNAPFFKQLHTEDLVPKEASGFKDGFAWIAAFIEVYGKRLEKKQREIYQPYCRAILFFGQGLPLKAYEQLRNLKRFQDVLLNLNVKLLYLRILFEMDYLYPEKLEQDEVVIEKVMEAFRALIRDEKQRKKQLSYQLLFYERFEFLFKKLYAFNLKYNNRLDNSINDLFILKRTQILQEINNTSFAYADWFEEKMKAIQ